MDNSLNVISLLKKGGGGGNSIKEWITMYFICINILLTFNKN